MKDCTCNQHADFCPEHPQCACGCPKHAHRGGACIAGSVTCHGCEAYRPAKLSRFTELCDDDLEGIGLDQLRAAYRALRAHRVEETTALWNRIKAS